LAEWQVANRRPEGRDLRRRDFKGVDLAGLTLVHASLAGASLDEADLRGALLRQVDLNGASLVGARLEGATLDGCSLVGADLRFVHGTRSQWEHCSLVEASLEDGQFHRARFSSVDLCRARLCEADLTRSKIHHACCTEVDLGGADLELATTLGSSFATARFSEARGYFRCRELILELFRREVHRKDLETWSAVGMITNGDLCYPQWKAYLEARPDLLEKATVILERYPHSGVLEAIQTGWTPALVVNPPKA